MDFHYCHSCHQITARAHTVAGEIYCSQCVEHQWRPEAELEALILVDSNIVDEAEIVCEALVLVR